MKLPWVSRFAYDGLRALYTGMLAEHREQRQEWSEERAKLLDRLANMVRQGFKPPDPLPPPPDQQPRLPALVEAALIGTGMDPRGSLARSTVVLATAWLASGMSPEEVARRIDRGAEG